MKKITIIISVLAMIFALTVLQGCAGTNCFEIGGTWGDKDLSGNFKYCWDRTQTETEGRPVLVASDTKNENLIALPESEIEKINNIVEGKLSQAQFYTKPANNKETPCQKLLRLLKDIK